MRGASMYRHWADRVDWPVVTLALTVLVVATIFGLHLTGGGVQQARLQREVRANTAQIADLQRRLDTATGTIALLHRELVTLAHRRHVTGRDLRVLARQTRPASTPEPTVTVTASPRPRPTVTVTHLRRQPCHGI